jgi:phage I-like protein
MTETEQLNQIFNLLGVATFSAATTAINSFNAFVTEAKSLTDESGTDKILASCKDACAFRTRVEKATAKSGDDAHGVILAALHSHQELPALRTKVAELEAKTTQQELDTLMAKARDAKKVTPAMEQGLREQVASGDITLKGCKAMIEGMHPISALKQKDPPAAAPSDAGGTGGTGSTAEQGVKATWKGKTYDELAPLARAELKKADPDLFQLMRADSQAALLCD